MARQSTNRQIAINDEFDSVVKGASKAVSDIVRETARVRLLVVFLHDNLLNTKGDLLEGDRIDLRDSLVPLRSQVQDSLDEIDALFSISDDNLATWQANFDAYLLANETVLDEALDFFPKVS